jgi:hypothetical protein
MPARDKTESADGNQVSILHIRRDWNVRVRFLHWFKTNLALSEVLEALKRGDIRVNDL